MSQYATGDTTSAMKKAPKRTMTQQEDSNKFRKQLNFGLDISQNNSSLLSSNSYQQNYVEPKRFNNVFLKSQKQNINFGESKETNFSKFAIGTFNQSISSNFSRKTTASRTSGFPELVKNGVDIQRFKTEKKLNLELLGYTQKLMEMAKNIQNALKLVKNTKPTYLNEKMTSGCIDSQIAELDSMQEKFRDIYSLSNF